MWNAVAWHQVCNRPPFPDAVFRFDIAFGGERSSKVRVGDDLGATRKLILALGLAAGGLKDIFLNLFITLVKTRV
jgi:hypothetical protein